MIRIIDLINSAIVLAIAFFRQKRFVQYNLVPLVESFYQHSDGTLPDKRKLLFNYATLVPMLLGTAYCALRGSKIKPTERYASTLQSSFSLLGDTFFDDDLVPEKDLDDLFNELYEVKGTNLIESLFIKLFKLYWQTANKNSFKKYFYLIYKAERESKIQEDPLSSLTDIENCTKQKGGYSMLLYRTAYNHEITAKEEEMLYKLGKAVQLSNDAFDIYKDYQNGIRTLVTECTDFYGMKKSYIDLINEIKELAYQLEIPKKNAKKFFHIMSLAVFCRTLVCFDALICNQEKTGGKFIISQYSRKQLVVDMEKPANVIKMLRYYIKM